MKTLTQIAQGGGFSVPPLEGRAQVGAGVTYQDGRAESAGDLTADCVSGIYTVPDGEFAPVRVRLCAPHRWVSHGVSDARDEPDRCPRCVASVDAVPGEDRFLRRFGR
jgi:hypothetical protein